MNVEVRFAETGHSDTFLSPATVSSLVSDLQTKYKNEFQNYCLINKKGRIMRPDDSLQDDYPSDNSNNLKEMTYIPPENNNSSSNTLSKCFYMFTDQLLNEEKEYKPEISEKDCMRLLEDKCRERQELKSSPFELRLLSKEDLLQLNHRSPGDFQFITRFHGYFSRIVSLKEEFGIVKRDLEMRSNKCENQRKSVHCLHDCLKKSLDKMNRRAKELKNKLLHIRNEIENGEQNKPSARGRGKPSEEFSRRNANTLEEFERKAEGIDEDIRTFDARQSAAKKDFKKDFNDTYSEIGNSHQKLEQDTKTVDRIFEQIKERYSSSMEKIKACLSNENSQDSALRTSFLDSVDPLIEQQFAEQSMLTMESIIVQTKETYKQFHSFGISSRLLVNQNYRKWVPIYMLWVKQQNEFNALKQQINFLLKDVELSKSPEFRENKDSCEAESWKRSAFNLKLKSVSKKLENMRLEQVERRKMFLTQIAARKSQLSFPEEMENLLNIAVPSVYIDYEATTDEKLDERYGQNDNENDFQVCFGGSQDRILKQLDSMNNKVKESFQNRYSDFRDDQKISNLVQLLEMSSGAFLNVYSAKLQTEKNRVRILEKDIMEKSNENRRFKEENKKYRDDLKSNKELKAKLAIIQKQQEKHRKQLLETVDECEELKHQKEELLKGSDELKTILQRRDSEIVHAKHDREQSQLEVQEVSKRLDGQFLLNEKLEKYVNEVIEENADLSHQLGQKQVKQVNLLKELESLQESFSIMINARNGDQPIEKLEQTPNLKAQFPEKQIKATDDLPNFQQQELQLQNSQLRSRVYELEEELNKVICEFKDTEDQQAQTQQPSHLQSVNACCQTDEVQSQTQDSSRQISVQSVSEGNISIFIPFDKHTYIAICLPESGPFTSTNTQYVESNLSTNLNGNQAAFFYILDLKSLPGKAQQLLRECSLIMGIKVTKVTRSYEQGCFFVEGLVQYAVGFEDDDRALKNYAGLFLPNEMI